MIILPMLAAVNASLAATRAAAVATTSCRINNSASPIKNRKTVKNKDQWIVRFYPLSGPVDSAPVNSLKEAMDIAKNSDISLRPTVLKIGK